MINTIHKSGVGTGAYAAICRHGIIYISFVGHATAVFIDVITIYIRFTGINISI
jgi:hypothetical protein